MGGVKLIAIEAKCFDLILEDGGKPFFFKIKERGRGFIKSLLLGRDASYWLLCTFKDKALFVAPLSYDVFDAAPASIPGCTSNKVMREVSFPRG